MSRNRKVDQRYLLPEVVDPPRRCLQIYIPEDTNHQRAFWAAIFELTNAWVWEWDGQKTGSLAGYVWSQIVQEASDRFYFGNGGCFMFLLRQNPENPCILEQSIDEGESWTTAFDFSLCIPPTQKTIFNISIQNQLNILLQAWIDASQDIIIIFPLLEYDGTGVDADRDLALCNAIAAYVNMVCQAVISILDDRNFIEKAIDWVNQVVGDVVYEISQIPYGTPVAWSLTKIASSILNSITGVSTTPYEDTDAINEVVCCMWSNLNEQSAGNSVQIADWQSALTGCTFSGNETEVALSVGATLFDNQSYLALMQFWNEAVILQSGGGNLDCPCVDDDFEILYDFTVEDYGFVGSPNNGNAGATYSAGVGFLCYSNTGHQGTVGHNINPPFNITEIDITFNVTAMPSSGNIGYSNLAVTQYSTPIIIPSTGLQTISPIANVTWNPGGGLMIYFIALGASQLQFTLISICVHGNGSRPPSIPNC